MQIYTQEEMAHFARSGYAKKYVDRKKGSSDQTATAAQTGVAAFAQFVFRRKDVELDSFVDQIKGGKVDPYDTLAEFLSFPKETRKGELKVNNNTLGRYVKIAKRFLKFNKCPLNNEDFKEQVSLPRKEHSEKKAADKQGVYGPRPMENCALRNRDIDLDKLTVTFRPEFSNMRAARTRPMTRELKQQTKMWLAEKYRQYRATINGRKVNFTPELKPDDLLFAPFHRDGTIQAPRSLYVDLSIQFRNLLENSNMDSWEENRQRREITQYTIRRFVKTLISDLGFGDFSEWWIGHNASTYYRKSEKEKAEMFVKIEPYLTFLDVARLEAHSADVEAQLKAVKDQSDRQIQVLTLSYEQKLQEMEARFLRELEARKEGFESQKVLEKNKERLMVKAPTSGFRSRRWSVRLLDL